jgi:glutamate 5-kinase
VRKQWIAGSSNRPVNYVWTRCRRRPEESLPAGIIDSSSRRGDALVVRDTDGVELARGLSAYSSDDAERIRGRKSGDIESILGFRGRDEMIHRDDLVVTGA